MWKVVGARPAARSSLVVACGEVIVGRGRWGGGGEADLAIDRGRWWPEGGGGRDGGGQRRKKWTGERRGRDGKGRKHEGGAVEL